MLTVNVELGERGYPIGIGAGLLGDQGLSTRIGQEVLREGLDCLIHVVSIIRQY